MRIRPALMLGGVLVISLAVVGAFSLGTAQTSAPVNSAPYTYLHFQGGCLIEGTTGQGVIDRRNGNTWCVPLDGSQPILTGKLNLAAITERPAARRVTSVSPPRLGFTAA
jgi:hypothetical protein